MWATVLGVDYDTFLNLTPKILNNAITEKLNYDNRMAYMNGLYVYQALSAVLGSLFGKTKISYLDNPIPLTKESEEEQERYEFEKKIARFNAIRVAHNAKFQEN